ncbi:MAG: hypothetical protein ACOYK7_13260 [Pirellulales bacterium]|jgi:hypothetical protein
MRAGIVLIWLLIPLGAVAWHLGPGVDGRARDRAAAAVGAAERHLAADDPDAAVAAYDQALAALPAADQGSALGIRLERAKARMAAADLATASKELGALVDELATNPGADPAVVADAHDTLATSDFYVTWLKRLEGLPRDEWEPHAESARQAWRLLADEAESRGDIAAARRHGEHLEAMIRLMRMNPEELQGLPIPSQCRSCKGGQCRSCKGRNPSKSKSPSRSRPDARGAGSGPPPDDSGS